MRKNFNIAFDFIIQRMFDEKLLKIVTNKNLTMIFKHAQRNNTFIIVFKITIVIFDIDENVSMKKNLFNEIDKFRNENVFMFDSNKFDSKTKNSLKISTNDQIHESIARNAISLNTNHVVIHQRTNENQKMIRNEQRMF